jgi:lysophospholipase L1-like esterase
MRIAALGVAVAILGGVGVTACGAASTAAPVDVAFLGDSYTYGTGATEPTDGYAYLVARAEGWSAKVVGLPGSGYVRVATDSGKRISAGIPTVIAADPKVLIVECGHNDADYGIDLAQVEPAALRDLRRLRAALPQTELVVMGPIWLTATRSPRAIAVRNAVHAAQRQIGHSRWIDPIAEGWFTGNRQLRTGDDRTMINYAVGHPNNRGYRHIAAVLEADLAALKLTNLA